MEEVPRCLSPYAPLVVIAFDGHVKRCAIEWLIAKIEGRKTAGCAELNVHVVDNRHNENTLLFISASPQRLLQGAEDMHFKKLDKDGFICDFTLKCVDEFVGSDDLDSFLSVAEQQRIILRELETVCATPSDKHIPGYDNVPLTPGNSILHKYVNGQIASNFFALHDEKALESLSQSWYQSLSYQPMEKIRSYFGESIGLYFSFLGMYTYALIPPCIAAVLFSQWQHPIHSAVFALFNLVWASLFLEMWKRRCSELTYQWGTFHGRSHEDPRPGYHGDMGYDPITGKPQPVLGLGNLVRQVYPKWKALIRYYCVSIPIICVCLRLSFSVMLWYFSLQTIVDERYRRDESVLNYLLVFSPTAAYAIVIAIMNGFYRKIAHFLNNWENHRLQTSFDNHLTFKLVIFDFVNSFSSLFYVAFYLQDMELLRSHLGALLITQQIVGQVKEALLPYVIFRTRTRRLDRSMDRAYTNGPVAHEHIDVATIRSANRQCNMDVYDGVLDDYLEMFLQFGYVFLFSAAFPLAAVCAFVNNLTEIRSDAFKLCRTFQRPFAKPASNIGAWQVAFECLATIAVITNCGLIAMNPEVQKLLPDNFTAVHAVLFFVAVEHVIMFLKWFIDHLIPDVPKWVRNELGRLDYRSMQALVKQRHEHAVLKSD